MRCVLKHCSSYFGSEWGSVSGFHVLTRVRACRTSSALQVATLLAVSPRTSGSSWQCLSQHRATLWGGEAEMPGENTDSWRACWREMVSGEAGEGERRKGSAWDGTGGTCVLALTASRWTTHIYHRWAPPSRSAFLSIWELEPSWRKTTSFISWYETSSWAERDQSCKLNTSTLLLCLSRVFWVSVFYLSNSFSACFLLLLITFSK